MLKPAIHFLYIALILICSPRVALGQYENKVIAHSGQAAPGTLGALFESFQPLGIGSDTLQVPSGTQTGGGTDVLFPDLVFSARLQAGTGDVLTENNEGIWLYQFNGFTLIARKGGVVPGVPNAYFLNDRLPNIFYVPGALGLEAAYSNTGSNDATTTKAFFVTKTSGNLEITIAPGMTVLPDVALTQNFVVYGFNGKSVLFSSTLSGSAVNNTNNRGVFIIDVATKNITVLARAGDPMAEIGGGFAYDDYFSFNRHNPLNGFGQTIFNITGKRGPPTEVIGAVYEGFTSGETFLFNDSEIGNPTSVFGDHRLNQAGEIAGIGLLLTDLTKETIWRTDLKFEDATTIITEGDATPGLEGDQFSAFLEFVLFDDRSLGFLAETEQDHSGIWIRDASGLHKVAATGDQAPGVPNGYNFFRVNKMVANPFGQVAFSDLAVAPTGEISGAWVGNQNGLLLLTQRGDTVELTDGTLKVLEDIAVSTPLGFSSRTGQDGHASNFNSSGDLLFTATLAGGGSALILAQPEGLVVNSTGDAEDSNPEDGLCDTGGDPILGRPECTLRAAIQEANFREGKDNISFDIPTDSENDPATIVLGSDLPEVSESVVVDGTTQEQDKVEITGPNLGIVFDLKVDDNIIKGLGINTFGVAIRLDGSSGNSVSDNYIGIGFDGKQVKGNNITAMSIEGTSGNNLIKNNVISGSGQGIIIINPDEGPLAPLGNNIIRNNLIGTDKDGLKSIPNSNKGISISGNVYQTTIQDNIISGNGKNGIDIVISVAEHLIKGNFIGIDSTGQKALANQGSGIFVSSSSNNTIMDNRISGNVGDGIHINQSGQDNLISNNFIGIGSLKNIANLNGITIDSSARTTIEFNVITGNTNSGIKLINGANENTIKDNAIGVIPFFAEPNSQIHGVAISQSHANKITSNSFRDNATGITIQGGELNGIEQNSIGGGNNGVVIEGDKFNKISRNQISNTFGLGIDLDFDGVTPNDERDLDDGTNGLQNFPELIKVDLVANALKVTGTISGEPNANDVMMEFFYNQFPGAFGHGPGQFYLGTFPVSFNREGNFAFEITMPFNGFPIVVPVMSGGFVAATGVNINGNTSEFSNYVQIELPDLSADLWVEVTDSLKDNTNTSVEIEYTIQYGNNGPDRASGVLLSNLLPENGRYIEEAGAEPDSTMATLQNLRYNLVADLAPGESREFTINALVDAVAGEIMNISTISSASADNTASNNSDTVMTNLDNIIITAITQEPIPISEEFNLGQNYPNPFSEKTTIKFSVPRKSTITMVVYDAFGKIVETLVKNIPTPAGNYELEYSPKNLNAGLYFYAIEAEKYFGVKKMIIIK